jgi:replicative DNA helicase
METAQTKIPPHNINTERAYLGSIILKNELLEESCSKITPYYFYDNNHRLIFAAMKRLSGLSKPIDIITLTTNLEENKTPVDSSYLVELVSVVPSSANHATYAKIIVEKYCRRQLLQLTDKIVSAVNDESNSVVDLMDRTHKSLKSAEQVLIEHDKTEQERMEMEIEKEVTEYNGDDRIISFKDVADDIKNSPLVEKFHTKWTKLDDLISGFRPKHLIVLSGIMKHGKTTFSMDMISKMAEYNPVMIALEEPIEELIGKFVERGEEAPHGFAPKHAGDVKTDWIDFKVREGKKKYQSRLFFIDNLEWIEPVKLRDSDNDANIYKRIMKELKDIAKKYGVCIVVIAHLNKDPEVDKNPTYHDLRGSSAIGQICDKCILVWRETKRGDRGELNITNNTNVSVQLNRQGGVGNVKMKFDNGHYTEYDWNIVDEDFERDFGQQKF